MRVYLPANLAVLRTLRDERRLTGPRPAYASTPALREWYASGDAEELEYAALGAAARAALRLLRAADPATPPRRVVLAVDVPDAAVTPRAGTHRAAVEVRGDVPLRTVAAVHVDEPAAESTMRAAVAALDAADAGDPDAGFAVDEADGFELQWWASQEIDALLGPQPCRPPMAISAQT